MAAQVAALERYLGRVLPGAVLRLYGSRASAGPLLPLATGRELPPLRAEMPPAERFLDAQERFDSVLGHAIGNRELAANRPADHIWPPGLLVLEDAGCGIVRAVDLDNPHLRIIEYEHLDQVDDPENAAGRRILAYQEPLVPRMFQHRFTVVASSLEDWVEQRGL
jgi:hypothetical protein